MTISKIVAREIIDSRGNPTIESEVLLENGARFIGCAPSGESTGTHEAVELRDGDENRFGGLGVLKAIENVKTIIAPELVGKSVENQKKLDDIIVKLDGTENKAKLGANATLSVSIAIAKAGAYAVQLPPYKYIAQISAHNHLHMPVAMFNVVNGGAHADNNLDIQEFMIVPTHAETFRERLRVACEHFHRIKKILQNMGLSTAVGDEGGFAPNLRSDKQAIDIILEAGKVSLAFDFAGNHPSGIDYKDLLNNNLVLSLEDPFGEDEWQKWSEFTAQYGDRVLVVGDDLLVTSKERLQKCIKERTANAIIIKPNQIGTVSEALEVVALAHKNNIKCIASHRSGETEDTFIADFAVGTGCSFIKDGAPSRGERVAKYNRLLRIEEELYER